MTDGDTITVLRQTTEGPRQVKIRLDGIDAPEKGQDFGSRAKQRLSDLVFGQNVRVSVKDTDRYGRIVARVKAGSKDASEVMVQDGMAWHYKKYSSDPILDVYEQRARSSMRGLWGHAAIPPWEYRDGNRSQFPKQSTGNRSTQMPSSVASGTSPEERRMAVLTEPVRRWHQTYRTSFAPAKRLGLKVAKHYNEGNQTALTKACEELSVAVSRAQSELALDEIPDRDIGRAVEATLNSYGKTAVECRKGRIQEFVEAAQAATQAFNQLGKALAPYGLNP